MARERFVEPATVEQAGQRIVVGEIADPSFQLIDATDGRRGEGHQRPCGVWAARLLDVTA
jgi:hypothetical protein